MLLAGYLLHYLPFFFYDRTLFLHHYLPAYMFKLMLAGYFVSHVHHLLSKLTASPALHSAFKLVVLVWCVLSIYVFVKFSVLSYAHKALTSDDVSINLFSDEYIFYIINI